MLAVAGGKGGCGKTTTAIGVARALTTMAEWPLVVDADRDMPDLHHRTNVDPRTGIADAADADRPDAVAQPSPRFDGVDVLPCRDASATAVASVLDRLARCDRRVVLDCPAGAGPDAALPLRAADRSILVSTPDERSLTDTAKTAAMARELDAPPVLTVLVRSDGGVDPSPLLPRSRAVHVPDVSEPLSTEKTASRYREIAKHLHKRNI